MTPSDQLLRNHAETLHALFDECDDVCLFMKNAQHRFVRCNRAMLRNYGLEDEADMLGKTDLDFHPPLLAKGYVDEDIKIMESGIPIKKAIWLVTTPVSSRWFSCTKLPIEISGEGKKPNIGIAGILIPYDGAGGTPESLKRIAPALTLADAEYTRGIKVGDLAAACGYSRNQFTRVFQELFHMSPRDYLLRLKMDHAKRMLEQTPVPITEIALQSGFYDHGALSTAFRKYNGMTPREYRKRFSKL